MKNKRDIKTEANRELIVLTAQRLFNEKGYEETTMADIVNWTGLANGTIYHLFKSKLEILSAIFHLHLHKRLGLCDNMQEKAQTPLLHVKQFLLDYEQLWVDAGWSLASNGYLLSQNAYSKIRDEILLPGISQTHSDHQYVSSAKDELYRFVVYTQKAGTSTTAVDANIIVNSIFIFGRGLLYQWSLAKGCYDLVENSKAYWDVFLPLFFTI